MGEWRSGSAAVLHTVGRGFESLFAHHFFFVFSLFLAPKRIRTNLRGIRKSEIFSCLQTFR